MYSDWTMNMCIIFSFITISLISQTWFVETAYLNTEKAREDGLSKSLEGNGNDADAALSTEYGGEDKIDHEGENIFPEEVNNVTKVEKSNKMLSGDGELSPGSKWTLGKIPYYIDTKTTDKLLAERIRDAMSAIESSSCLLFEPLIVAPEDLDSSQSFMYIWNPKNVRECQHFSDFPKGGPTYVVFGLDCLKQSEILHTLMHALGFGDEVAHPQRDHYVSVQHQNIVNEAKKYFSTDTTNYMNVPTVEFDPHSIMMFHDRAFTANGEPTIKTWLSGLTIKPSDELSQLDKLKLNVLFQHECNRRDVVKLIDSCRNVFSGETPKTNPEEPEQSKENSVNVAPTEQSNQDPADNSEHRESREN